MNYYRPVDKNAIPESENVLRYLADINGKKIITGQHTQTMAQEERCNILEVTGKEPALLGFELLSYSPNINYLDTDDECIAEVELNRGTMQRAWEWAARGGLITFTWHWFSPLGGHSKSFFSENTDFDAEKALVHGTPENNALLSDMDYMAGLLRPFCDKHIPILWRPFHESEGTWFWWGANGAETAKQLYRLMFRHFTEKCGLHNLIWVWNSPLKEGYPGDDCVDIISRDMYPPAHEYTSHKNEYDELTAISKKIAAIAETGVLPDIEAAIREEAAWSYFMTWSHEFCLGEKYTSYDHLRNVYNSELAVTIDKLPQLYLISR
ncbi:MAG: beta-mannosidase [Oscillospiraceae bacterium]|nr:beta-mannosidase [Oscillospiraceae bacterium]